MEQNNKNSTNDIPANGAISADLAILKDPRGSEDPSIITTLVSEDDISFSSKLDEREDGLTYIEILINFVKGMIGSGCLSLPMAFRKAGLWAGLCLFLGMSLINYFSMQKLVRCSQRLSKSNTNNLPLNYGNVAHQTLSHSFAPLRRYNRIAKLMVNASIVCVQIGACGVYIVICSESVKEFCDFHSITMSTTTSLVLVFFPILLISFVRSLRVISVLSTIGNVICFVALAFIWQHLIRAGHNPLSSFPAITDFEGIMSASGQVSYSLGGHTMVLPLENSLKKPSHMVGPTGIVSVGMTIVATVDTTMGFLGYITYGPETKAMIIQNLPELEIQFVATKMLFTLVIYLGFVIHIYIIMDLMWPELSQMLKNKWPKLQTQNNKMTAIEMGIITALVVISMSIGIVVPDLDLIISLFGVTIGTLLALIWPALIDIFLFLPIHLAKGQRWRSVWLLIQDLGLIAIGIFALVAGLRANIQKMMESSIMEVIVPVVTNATVNGLTS